MTTRTVDELGFETRQVHAGEPEGTANGARIPPIYLTAGYLFDSFDTAEGRFAGTDPGYIYSRISNPTNAVAEQRLASLEGGVSSILVGSGQAASALAALSLAAAGDHILVAPDIYEGTRTLFRAELGRLGIDAEFVEDAGDLAEWEAKIRPTTKFLYGETISNPTNQILDIAAVAGIGRRHGVPLIVDNTLATPYLSRPIELGAAIVVHSASKFLAGHGASIGGALIDGGTFDWTAHRDRFPQLHEPWKGQDGPTLVEQFGAQALTAYARTRPAASFGPSLSPLHAFLLLQGLETLSLRMERHVANALALARWLEQQPEVLRVDHAGLSGHPHATLAAATLPRGAGGVFAFTLRGGRASARTLIDGVQLISRMTHIGDVRSLILNPETTTHARLSEADRRAAGVTPGLIRLSVGLELVDDLIADLDQAFAALRASGTADPGE